MNRKGLAKMPGRGGEPFVGSVHPGGLRRASFQCVPAALVPVADGVKDGMLPFEQHGTDEFQDEPSGEGESL